ncbi:MAG: mercuric reductase [Bacteroidota bacterium]
MKQYDAIIIGSGQAANPLATRLAAIGWEVALVEKKHIGGTCINEGCTPTKTLIASAKLAFQFARSGEYGLENRPAYVDISAVLLRKESVVKRFRSSLQKGLINQENVDILFGKAEFTGHKEITVTDSQNNKVQFRGKYIFINTGARPFVPAIKGLETIPYFTSSSILDLQEIPERLIIIGAGPVAIEFAQVYSRLGSDVIMIGRSDRLLEKEDPDVGEEIKSILQDEGILMLFSTEVDEMGNNSDGVITLRVSNKNGKHTVTGTHVLIATGRIPNSDALHPNQTGVETDENGYIIVNEKLETGADGIYALGDVKGGPAFTHIAYNDYLVVYKNLVENKNVTIKERPVPYCIFTDPEFARIGLNETEAREKNLPVEIAKVPVTWVARATETGEPRGFIKAIVHAQTKKILGAAVIGAGGGELMAILQIAMLGGVTAEQLAENIFAHPTWAEAINILFQSLPAAPAPSVSAMEMGVLTEK